MTAFDFIDYMQVTHYEGDIISVRRITILNSSVWK